MVSRVRGIWLREYGIPGFVSTGYMVSEVLGYRVHSFSQPVAWAHLVTT